MMGSPIDFRDLLRACETHSWTPVVDSARPLAKAGDALSRMAAGEQYGKLVLTT
jgi:D-arabinose 1-dehydrogenase-like Zn-dependent alcohol dehydrogenase